MPARLEGKVCVITGTASGIGASSARLFAAEGAKVVGIDLDGNEVVIEGDELLGRIFLHEIDHLDGVLMFDRMDRAARKAALKEYRENGPRNGAAHPL